MNKQGWYMRLGKGTDADPSVFIQEANELLFCNYGFHQSMNPNGQASSGVHIGTIQLAFKGLPSDNIIKWAMSSYYYLNGMMVYFEPDGRPVKKVYSEDGACVGMSIDYREGGSILTTLSISPRVLSFPYSGNSVSEIWPPNLLNTAAGSQTRSEGFRSHGGVSTLKMDFEGIKEEENLHISRFHIEFGKNIFANGKPCSRTRGGIINFSIASLPNAELERWMMEDNLMKDGKFIFWLEDEGSPLKIHFENAYCIDQKISTTAGKAQTDFTLSANIIWLNEFWHWNHFAEPKAKTPESNFLLASAVAPVPPTPKVMVTKVKADVSEAMPFQKVKCTVTGYNTANVPLGKKNAVQWRLKVDGEEVSLPNKKEETEIEMKKEWMGKEVIIMPYLVEPDEKVSAKVKVITFPKMKFFAKSANEPGKDRFGNIAEDMTYGDMSADELVKTFGDSIRSFLKGGVGR